MDAYIFIQVMHVGILMALRVVWEYTAIAMYDNQQAGKCSIFLFNPKKSHPIFVLFVITKYDADSAHIYKLFYTLSA